MEAPKVATGAQFSMLRVEFEVAVDDMEVVIDFLDDKVVNFTPAHHGIMVQLSEPPGTYDWRAILKGQHVSSGKVTLAEGQLAEIRVPRPKLSQLIAGRWESDPDKIAVDWGGEDQDNGDFMVELEFEGDLAMMAIRQSGDADRSQYRVRIDESVTPALIDLTQSDGQQLIGIAKFQVGRKSHFQRRGPYIASPLAPGESEMTMTAESMGDGSDYEGGAIPGGAPSMGFGGPGMATSSEPDRLQICLAQGHGLRPWEFQADEERGHMVFTLVRSRESGSLWERLALDPVKLETSPDLIKESVKAWSKRLKIDAEGTNSVGIEMVLVPPAGYHIVDSQTLGMLRRQLPESGSYRDAVDSGHPLKYEIPTEVKERLGKSYYLSYPFVMSRNAVSVSQFRQFVTDTGYITDAERGAVRSAADFTEEQLKELNSRLAVAAGGDSGVTIPWGYRRNILFDAVLGLMWEKSAESDVPGDGTSSVAPTNAVNAGRIDDSQPVTVISRRDAEEFCKWLTEKEGRQYRLPTSEEWTVVAQLGAARKLLPSRKSDDPALSDYRGWFDANSKQPLGIDRSSELFAEWTQDVASTDSSELFVLVHHEVSADAMRFYSGIQYTARQSFRAADIGFRVVAELLTLAPDKSDKESADSPPAETE
jgi:formylglycine-generating enzyme required for sulfatase activity